VESPESLHLGMMLLALAFLVGMARLMGEVARWVRQPAILGELLAGIILGPTILGAIAPDFQTQLFPQSGPGAVALESIGSLAIVLFLLVAGMEVDLSIAWKQGPAALRIGFWGTVIPFAVGFAAALAMPGVLDHPAGADLTIFALFLATAMAISALPVIAKTLLDLDLYRTDLGMIVISAAVFNDLFGWTVFAVILGWMGTGTGGLGIVTTLVLTLAYTVLMLTVGRWAMNRILPILQAYTHYPGGVLGFAVTVGLLGAALTEYIGVHAIFGAFLVGVALGDSPHLAQRTRVLIDEFIACIFAPLFFASIGLKMDFVAHFDAALVALVLVLACVSKLIGSVLGAKWSRFSTRDQWAIGFAMNARGAMEIILGTLALEAGIIGEPLFVALVVMAFVTSALSGPLIRRTLRRQQRHRLTMYLSPKQYVASLDARTAADAVAELAGLVAQQTSCNRTAIQDAVFDGGLTARAGIGGGIAMPRARLTDLVRPLVAVGISKSGIHFDAPDGRPVHVVFLLVMPEKDATTPLDLSADIFHLMREPQCLERILRASNYTEFLSVIRTSLPK
jgi:Kef-type K+ transport system membrane component KefB/mannitol/fructose-specific phosphotransferase system IIA component (Ntr-type)